MKTAADIAPHFETGSDDMAEALTRMAREDAVSLPLLELDECAHLAEAANSLNFRRATPVIGQGDKAVFQDFDLCHGIPAGSPFHGVAAALEKLLARALGKIQPPLLSAPPRLNDLIVQRYPAGCSGISPHRDHLRYEGLVVIVPLSGQGRFFLCEARDGRNPREIPAPLGSAVIMRAPGFGGSRARPFHYVKEIAAERLSFGLRHDVRSGPRPA